MKRPFRSVLLILLVTLLFASRAFAQAPASQLIVLDDAVPAVDIVITLPPDTGGAVSLDLDMAAVSMTGADGATVLYAADPRVYAIELDIAANTGTHTITLERLPGVSTAYVTLKSADGLTPTDGALRVSTGRLENNQEQLLALSPSAPGGSVDFVVPENGPSVLSALMPQPQMTLQVSDAEGAAVVTAYNDLTGMNVVIGAGAYNFTVLGQNLAGDVMAGVRLQPLSNTQIEVMSPRLSSQSALVAAPAAPECQAQVSVTSANMRSGPGTGYSVLDYVYRDDVYPVGGENALGNWVVIGKDGSSGWVSRNLLTLSGSCSELTVFNVPFRNAAAPAIIVQTSQDTPVVLGGGTVVQTPPSDSGGHDDDDDHDDDHDDDDDDDDDDDEDDD